MEKTPFLKVEDLKKYYSGKGGFWNRNKEVVRAVDGVSFTMEQGETLGLVGESGCGKSTLGRQIVGLERPDAGHVWYQGQDLQTLSGKELKPLRTQLQMVFQDSYSSLNPRKHIYEIISEPMLYHGLTDKEHVRRRTEELLDMVGLPKNALGKYPHEFSGGQRQRIGIARALSLKPKLLVCDEPVSALDVSIQAQILNLFKNLQKELDLTYIFIGHGLGAVNYVSDRIAVMYLGRIVELAETKELFANPVHPYAKALFAAVPEPDPGRRTKWSEIPAGEAFGSISTEQGCPFASRCPYCQESCRQERPKLEPITPGSSHLAACPVMTGKGV